MKKTEDTQFCIGDENSRKLASMMSFTGNQADTDPKVSKKSDASKQKRREIITFILLGMSMITFPFLVWLGLFFGLLAGVSFMWSSNKSAFPD